MKKHIRKKYHCTIVPPAARPACAHDEIFENMCCLCGAIITRRAGYRVIDPTVTVQSSALYVRQTSKQALIFDIDNTLLVAQKHSPRPETKTRASEHWSGSLHQRCGGPTDAKRPRSDLDIDVVWRPGAIDGLRAAADAGLTLYLHTKGSRPYADEVRRRINDRAGRTLIEPANVMSRDEERGAGKSLAHFFSAADPHVVVIDDRVDVWGADALYVLQLPPLEWPRSDAVAADSLAPYVDTALSVFDEWKRGADATFADTLRRVLHGRAPEEVPTEDDIADLHQALVRK